ncbi:ferritin-like domain-containing protein [Sphingobium sp. HWE2-09]|uniref:ferritin-like domain-containing protein n=1 Tax=Sphingobium sp. HWE2-09 TaxID=3108390 RepID=UPI002DCE34B8|nr:ferritin-like domain-containing protein [Sphingobium sp. HWE2-09]
MIDTAHGQAYRPRVREWLRQRYLDLLGSIYIYNEHRGYTAIDRVLEAIRVRSPDDIALIAAVERHRADERKHYLMFRRWFELRGTMPLHVDRACGHIDRFVEIMFHRGIDQLDTQGVIDNDDQFEKLCRIISLTEKRGFKQVETLLAHPLVRDDKVLMKIFAIVHRDEPSHWAPYDDWLRSHHRREHTRWEKAVDGFIHSELLFLKLPLLFLNPFMRRRADWPDAAERMEAVTAHFDLA